MKNVRVGMAQILVEGAEPAANLRRASEMAERAARAGCELVVFPECLDIGWTHPAAREMATPIPGRSSDALLRAAVDAGVWLAAGLVEREGDSLFNTALLISPAGEIAHQHRKVNELALAHDLYAQGATVGAADTPFGRIGLSICADNYPDSPELGSALGRMGCSLLLSPCAWAVDGDHDDVQKPYGALWLEAYTALAERYAMGVVGVSCVGPITGGPWQGRRCVGRSLAVGPGGEVLAHLPADQETLGVVEFALDDGEPYRRVSSLAASFR